jgi:4-diphosphocytidyl-2-C-methyl-D-erythritol kinase
VSRPRAALSIRASAKINLFLRVLGRRSDGFHELETLFQAVDLCDDVSVTRVEDGVTLDVEGGDLGPVEENLAHRAARALLAETGATTGFHVRLRKRIPAGAGLGGGSSDAAAVLRAANALLPDPVGPDALSALGATLGSDVPFFLGSSALARGTGRGERLEALPTLPEAAVVLVLPPVHVATATAYAALAEARAGGGEAPCFGHVADTPSTWEEVATAARNDFEEVVPAMVPEVARALLALRDSGASPALLSGSGGACFGIFAEARVAQDAADTLRARTGFPAIVTRTLSRFPEPTREGVSARGAGDLV